MRMLNDMPQCYLIDFAFCRELGTIDRLFVSRNEDIHQFFGKILCVIQAFIGIFVSLII